MGRAGWLVCVLCAGCVNTTSNFCSDGTVCPGGFTCDVAHNRCLLPEQTSACDGKQEADSCTVADMPGACRSGACETFYCGDGYVTTGEDCDGSNVAGLDCKAFGFYGSAGLTCTDSCTFDLQGCRDMNDYCGDGKVNGAELCDGPQVRTCVALGFDAGTASCDLQCGFTIADCSRFGWNPESLSDVVAYAVAGTAPNDQWAFGDHGRALHFEGLAWNDVPTGVPNTLINGWSNGPSDTWAVGQSTNTTASVVIHHDGTMWQPVAGVPAGEYVDVWGTSPTTMFVATLTDVLAYDGQMWTIVGNFTGTPKSLRGTGPSDIWVATVEGPLMHWDGSSWTNRAPAGTTIEFLDANAPNDVWAIGWVTANRGDGVVAHYNGTTWQQWIESPATYNAVASSAPNDTWVAGSDGIMRHWDGVVWSRSTNIGASPSGLTALSGLLSVSPSEVVGVSTLNLAYRYRGQAFGLLPPVGADPFSAAQNNAIWGPEDNVFIANAKGEVWHFDGTAWAVWFTLPGASPKATDVWGAGVNDVYVGGSDGKLYQFTGGMWTSIDVASVPIAKVWGSSSSDVWAFASTTAYHKNGTSWDASTIDGTVQSVSGTGPSDVWIIAQTASGNEVEHWDGAAWTVVDTHASTEVLAVAAVAPNDVHVSARQGRMEHYNGNAWSESLVSTLADITVLQFTAADDVVGISQRDVVHYNGIAWANIRPPIDFVPNTDDYIPIKNLHVLPDRIDVLLDKYRVRTLIRTRPLICRQTEDCTDGVDNDCDGKLDAEDPDCP